MTSADFSQFVVTARLLIFEASPARPPQLWTHSFRFIPAWFTVVSSDSYRAFASVAALPLPSSLLPSSCSSGQPFAAGFLQIPPHDGHPCLSRWTPLPLAVTFPLSGRFGDLRPLEYVRAGRTTKRRPGEKSLADFLSPG